MLNIYPNPAKETFRLSSNDQILEVVICSASGELIEKIVNQDTEIHISIAHYLSGIYFAKVHTSEFHGN